MRKLFGKLLWWLSDLISGFASKFCNNNIVDIIAKDVKPFPHMVFNDAGKWVQDGIVIFEDDEPLERGSLRAPHGNFSLVKSSKCIPNGVIREYSDGSSTTFEVVLTSDKDIKNRDANFVPYRSTVGISRLVDALVGIKDHLPNPLQPPEEHINKPN